jgi:hypothetical protein
VLWVSQAPSAPEYNHSYLLPAWKFSYPKLLLFRALSKESTYLDSFKDPGCNDLDAEPISLVKSRDNKQ